MSNKKIKNIREIIIESIECEPGVKGCTANPDTCPNSPDVCDKKLSMFGYYDETIKGSVEDTLRPKNGKRLFILPCLPLYCFRYMVFS